MERGYSFFHDELAMTEIRRYRQKCREAGREIGCATAALEWIQNYGKTWEVAKRIAFSQDG